MCFRGVWGTISDFRWDNLEAAITCRQLGFEPSGMSICVFIVKYEYCAFAGFNDALAAGWLNLTSATAIMYTMYHVEPKCLSHS